MIERIPLSKDEAEAESDALEKEADRLDHLMGHKAE